jgi:hypothetical protein
LETRIRLAHAFWFSSRIPNRRSLDQAHMLKKLQLAKDPAPDQASVIDGDFLCQFKLARFIIN